MTDARSFREGVDALAANDDLLDVDERVSDEDVAAVAAEAARSNGPAVRFTETSGVVTPVSGAFAGPEQVTQSSERPWKRIATALGLETDASYRRVVERVAAPLAAATEPAETDLLADPSDADCYSLGLPPLEPGAPPAFTLGVLAFEHGDETRWLPVRGSVRGTHRVRAVVPADSGLTSSAEVSLCLGVPGAAVTNTLLHWLDRSQTGSIRPGTKSDAVPTATHEGRVVPATSEVLFSGRVADFEAGSEPSVDGGTAWELAMETEVVDVSVDAVAHRESPLVPFVPLGTPLTDDVQLVGITESARLNYRVNNYWGIEPVEWIRLPAEMSLGMCVVASEILYAGFEWQLSNTLFAFSSLFDKILILDENTSAADLSRPLDDIWVKAHPSQDWVFSEPSAPAATAPRYRTDGEPGSRLFINATWDPRWDEEYIAPRVTYETSYPEEVRRTVAEMWSNLGFDSSDD
ncbi:UbiD family decarboxylase [Halomicroarcula limicola]|uniref:UbiD family decarboxylase n=1 Tax=Haloarcula limicola TaxID=1429915 RepID=A0A8J8C9Z7_9EURY|nr:UbiD family decarboxylase domain-containing protein [Halomicroarcula limicola]MBV0925975.1 UbiD family decarboxylase [Halomicroarcula limicola]